MYAPHLWLLHLQAARNGWLYGCIRCQVYAALTPMHFQGDQLKRVNRELPGKFAHWYDNLFPWRPKVTANLQCIRKITTLQCYDGYIINVQAIWCTPRAIHIFSEFRLSLNVTYKHMKKKRFGRFIFCTHVNIVSIFNVRRHKCVRFNHSMGNVRWLETALFQVVSAICLKLDAEISPHPGVPVPHYLSGRAPWDQ